MGIYVSCEAKQQQTISKMASNYDYDCDDDQYTLTDWLLDQHPDTRDLSLREFKMLVSEMGEPDLEDSSQLNTALCNAVHKLHLPLTLK